MGRSAEQIAAELPVDLSTAQLIVTRSERARRREAKHAAKHTAGVAS
jgi:hypothetical protein